MDGSEPPRQLAGGGRYRAPRWAPDSRSVFVLAGQLYRVWLTGEAEVLTRWEAGISDCRPLADPDLVVLIAPEHREDQDIRVCGRHVAPDRLWLLDLRDRSVRLVRSLAHLGTVRGDLRAGAGGGT
ncbi:hypothetical protein LWP59_06340 [Amycolatopsis acidiphila]|uniref:S9 family peptidase n=1 Tax=Amycolatopsis acidiphila TaxID=715473 RepID=A0A558AAE3_9PSEU|nr:hypothetical protein [Amycolatopsis acidiphila]TVT21231.1 hypothetical protein FNH06_17700 [Amycolatopsis acidiphila]UIJ61248.1 hypothetical protein LWP59_06340 [Amycolatopsis acidiphila]GHG78593.1 hypothetical protein GCM10017788_45980 [Amycolatopsis acidiphila]